jgi:hypothetical protein
MKHLKVAVIVLIIIIIMSSISIVWLLNSPDENINNFSIYHLPIEFTDNMTTIQLLVHFNGELPSQIILNYTDVGSNEHSINMVSTDSVNYIASIPKQNTLGTVIYSIWANSINGSSLTTQEYSIKILFPIGGYCTTKVMEEVINQYSDRNETVLYEYVPEDEIIGASRPLFMNTTVSNSSDFTHFVTNYEILYYIPVLFSNDTDVRTCVIFNLETGNLTPYFFKGDLFINNTKVLSSELYGNITVTSLHVTDEPDYSPSVSKDEAISSILAVVKTNRGQDTQTSIVMVSNPVEWENNGVVSYYWLIDIPNLWPGTFSQGELWMIPCDSIGTIEHTETIHSITLPNNVKVMYGFFGSESFLTVRFNSPEL